MSTTLERPRAVPAPKAVAALPPRRRPRPVTLLGLLSVACFAGYVAVGWYLRYDLNYAIGDALARSANAKYILLSRDPHLAALGFDWMPLPTVFQIPLLPFLEPFGRADFAGPLLTAALMAGTVFLLGRLCRGLGLGFPWHLLLPLAFAVNPVVVLYAANGMSEACLFFFLALTAVGLSRYAVEASFRHLTLLGTGLAGVTLSRYEALPAVAVLAAGVAALDLNRAQPRRVISTAAIVGLPPFFAAVLWFCTQYVIKGSFLAFRTGASTTSRVDSRALEYLPVTGDQVGALAYVTYWTLILGPFLLFTPLLMLPPYRKTFAGLTLIAAGATFPAISAKLLLDGGSFGNPRYFVSAIIFSAITACWLATRKIPRLVGWVWRLALVAGLAYSAVPATIALTDPVPTRVEREYQVLGRLVGQPTQVTFQGGDTDPVWREAARLVDQTVGPDELVLSDARYNFPAILYAEHSERFIINSDRDFLATVADPTDEFEYILAPPKEARGGLAEFDAGGQILRNSPPGTWELVQDFGVTGLYRLVNEDIELPPVTQGI